MTPFIIGRGPNFTEQLSTFLCVRLPNLWQTNLGSQVSPFKRIVKSLLECFFPKPLQSKPMAFLFGFMRLFTWTYFISSEIPFLAPKGAKTRQRPVTCSQAVRCRCGCPQNGWIEVHLCNVGIFVHKTPGVCLTRQTPPRSPCLLEMFGLFGVEEEIRICLWKDQQLWVFLSFETTPVSRP